jgi:hypothetical protein
MVDKYLRKMMYNSYNFRACHFCVVKIFAGGPPNREKPGSGPPVGIFIVGLHLHFKMQF